MKCFQSRAGWDTDSKGQQRETETKKLWYFPCWKLVGGKYWFKCKKWNNDFVWNHRGRWCELWTAMYVWRRTPFFSVLFTLFRRCFVYNQCGYLGLSLGSHTFKILKKKHFYGLKTYLIQGLLTQGLEGGGWKLNYWLDN